MRRVFMAVMVLFVLAVSVPGEAATIDIAVTAAGDRVFNWDKSSSYVYTWWTVEANPNQVAHYYDYDNRSGSYQDTALSFDLTSLAVPVADIISASFNFNILSIWGADGTAVGSLNTLGTVYNDGVTGWKAFDITESLKFILTNGGTTADYYFSHASQSGFTFGSAEGGQPAFLRINTAAGVGSPVPIPAAVWLFGTGLLGLFGVRRKIRN